MKACTKWWARCYFMCQAGDTFRQALRCPVLSIPLPKRPDVSISVDYVGAFLIKAGGNSVILFFIDHFGRHADTYVVIAAEFPAEGTANILVNRFVSLWKSLSTLLSDNGSQFCAQLATAVYKLLDMHKVTTSADHPSENGDVDRVNYIMAQMLAVICNEHQNDRVVHLPQVEYT